MMENKQKQFISAFSLLAPKVLRFLCVPRFSSLFRRPHVVIILFQWSLIQWEWNPKGRHSRFVNSVHERVDASSLEAAAICMQELSAEEVSSSVNSYSSCSVEKELGLKSSQLLVSELQSVENVNVEVPPLRNPVTDVNARSESVLHDCLKSTRNQWKPSVLYPFMITTYLQTHEILPDPFQNELLRIQKEKELVLEMNEKMKLQLKLEHDKEVQNLEKKYRTSLEDIEALTLSRKISLDIIFDKLQMNQVIAEQFLSNFFETSVASSSNNSRLSALSTQQQHPPGPASSPPSTLPVSSTRV